MELLNLPLPIGILDHATIFAETSERQRLNNGRRHDQKRRFALIGGTAFDMPRVERILYRVRHGFASGIPDICALHIFGKYRKQALI